MHRPDYLLYSDGSSDVQADAGSACILVVTDTKRRAKINAYLGPASNSEAELMAGVLGLALARVCAAKTKNELSSLEWFSDNLGVVQGVSTQLEVWRENGWLTTAGEPLRDKGLWQALNILSSGLDIKPCFARRDLSPPLQRSCDKAARWAQQRGKVLLQQRGEGPLGRLSRLQPANAWHLIDSRDFIENCRHGEVDVSLLIEKVSAFSSLIEL